MIYIYLYIYIYIYIYICMTSIYLYIYIYIWYIYVTNLFFAHHIAIFHIAQWQVADLFRNCPRNKETKFHLYVFTNFFDIRKQSLRATLKKGVSNISGSKIKHVNFWIYFDFFEFLVQCEINYYQRRLVSIIFFIISEFSLRRRFSKISHGADTGDNNILY